MKKILIVDDAQFMRLSIRRMLENNDFEIVGEAINGQDAFEKYKIFKPDIVTMDITMPDVNGLEGLKLIKEYDSKAKVTMVTAMGQESIVKDCIIQGAVGFIIKPFKEDVLIKTLNKI